MANLLKVVLVADDTALPANTQADVKYFTIENIISIGGGGIEDLNLSSYSIPHVAIALPDQSVAVWHLNLSLETLPTNVALIALFTEIARTCVPNARLVIEARHPSHDSFIDDERCVRAITVNKLKSVLEQTQSTGDWWLVLSQLELDPEFLPVIKDMAPQQRDFELRTRRNAIKQSRLSVQVKNQNPDPNYISCYADVPGVKPFAFTVYRDWKLDQYLSPEVVLTGQWEPYETHILLNIMRGLQRQWGQSEAARSLKFFNVGGNIGWYSTLILNANDYAQVTAFEPVSTNFALLQRNIAPNAARATLHNFALSDTTGETSFYVEKGNYGGSSLVERPDGYIAKETVQLHTFDELYAEVDAASLCDLMVMDIEGAEHKFFNGARQLFARGFSPIMMLEYNPSLLKMLGSDGTFVHDLVNWGYRLYVIDRSHGGLRPITPEMMLQQYARLVDGEAYLNYLAVPAKYDLAQLLG